MPASWTEFVFEHKPPCFSTLGAYNIQRIATLITEFFISGSCLSATRTFKCIHLDLFLVVFFVYPNSFDHFKQFLFLPVVFFDCDFIHLKL